ncbi:MAG: lipoyl(octanoyl) transferase LipB [Bacteroidales bacterium]|nr:lipoyl(octanoyl) transferase LipB [Bacteroidales bacterium]
MQKAVFKDLGQIEFGEAWKFQQGIFNEMLQSKKMQPTYSITHELLFCEHPHVYTLGKSGNDSNLLINEKELAKYGASFFHIDRGGDITYHGPGQLVAYPIFDIQTLKIGIKEYVHRLEEVVIQSLAEYQIEASRLEGATGVWLDAEKPSARKICAIGVKASRFITMHGFAFNINTDLNYFNYINPCGFVDKGVTSLSKELGQAIDFEAVKKIVLHKFIKIFDLNFD